jgi:hypothetical protein
MHAINHNSCRDDIIFQFFINKIFLNDYLYYFGRNVIHNITIYNRIFFIIIYDYNVEMEMKNENKRYSGEMGQIIIIVTLLVFMYNICLLFIIYNIIFTRPAKQKI